jgi:predicted Zn-dependent protease
VGQCALPCFLKKAVLKPPFPIAFCLFVLATGVGGGCASEDEIVSARANLYLRAGAVSPALAMLRARAKTSTESNLQVQLGQTLLRAQRFSEAESQLQHALPDATAEIPRGEIERSLAQIAARTGRTGQAEAMLLIRTTRVPTDNDAHMALGILRQFRGDSTTARSHFEAVLQNDTTHPAALYNLGRTLLFAGDRQNAQRQFETLAQRFPEKPYGAYGLALVAWRSGDEAQACRALEKARALGLDSAVRVRRDNALGDKQPRCLASLWGNA